MAATFTAGTAPWPHNYVPKPGEFATLFQTLSVALNTAGPTLVGTNTTNVYVGIPATKTIFVAGASMQGGQVFTSGSTTTAQLFKKHGSTATALTDAYDLTAALSTAGYADVPLTAKEADLVLAPGDTLYWNCIFGGVVLPSTADLRAVVEISVQS